MESEEEYYPSGKTALEYACTSWHVHLAQAREDVTALIPTLRRFLEEKTRVWLRALARLEAAGALTATKVFKDALANAIPWAREVRLGLL